MSLHKTVEAIKKFGLVIIGIVILMMTFNILIGIATKLTPKKVPPPTVSFGKLPPIPFPQSAPQVIKPTYTLDTISGDFPSFPDRVSIYTFQQFKPGLLSLRNAQTLISGTDFPNQPKELSDIIYQWTSTKSPYKILTYNIVTGDFSLTSSYITDPYFLGNLQLQDQPGAIGVAKGYLTSLNGFPTDIDDTKTQTTLYSIDTNAHTLQPAISISTTQIVQVDFFQKDIDEIPIFYSDPLHSLFSTIVANNTVVAAQASHKIILPTPSATYPIKSPSEAFKELQEGKAYIAAAANPPASTINIRDISLGYYIGNGAQTYLMPIVVMQGDNGFYAYVSAVTDLWVQN